MRFSYYKRPLCVLMLCWAAVIMAFRFASPPSQEVARGLPPLPAQGIRLEGRVAQYPVHSGNLWRFAFEVSSVGRAGADTVVMAYAADLGGASYGDRAAFTAALASSITPSPGILTGGTILPGGE